MIKEYYKFIKDYLKLAELKPLYVIINIVSAFLYKLFGILLPLVGALIVKYLTIKNVSATYMSLGLFLVIYILYKLSLYINFRIYGYNVNYCYDKLSTKILKKLTSVDGNFIRVVSKGRIMNSINADLFKIGEMNDCISEIFAGLLQVIAVFIIITFYNIYLAIIFVIFAYIYVNFRNRADRHINIYHNKTMVQEDKYSTLLTQIISGLQEIKTFDMLPKLTSKLENIHNKFTKCYMNKRFWFTIKDNDIRFIVYLFRYFLYILLIYFMCIGKIKIEVLVLIISYHEQLVDYLYYVIQATSTIREVNTSVNRINNVLDYDSTKINYGTLDLDEIYGSIEFFNVSLSIKNKKVLDDINLKIKHNEVVAIVGEAGSGKTMLINLLLRLYKPTNGRVTLDNIDIFDYSKDIYSKNVAVANQKPFIFNMSIRKNLNFVDSNIKNQIEACKRAGIHDFIETLPNGYNTILRENGSNISGGQKQMISIARTILSEAEVLLLDDITTSLDPDTAKLVPKLVKDLKKDHTIIMITKKPDLMKSADRIVVLDNGKIVGVGKHKELIDTCEIYAMLQSRKSASRIGVFNND